MSVEVPQQIGRYEIIEHVGTGAMADIYRARDPEIDRVVAVKVLKETLADDDDLERFTREARAAGALTHPNIVTIHDVGRFDDQPYITMELVEGPTLEDLMISGRRMSDREIIEITLALANALNYAHENSVVHRDIKPSNILFVPGTNQPKIADFGIARVESPDQALQTQSGIVIGTPRYMSPEQAMGEVTDGRTDLFALGVILFEMLTGAKAFDAPTTTSLLIQIAREEPRSFKDVEQDVPIGLQRIVRKLLAKKPARRFQSGAQLAEALNRELENAIEREADADRNKYVPLRIKWALTMGGIVALVMGLSILTVVTIQSRVIRTQVVDSGTSLARFIATEAATPVLGEDWIRLETFVGEAAKRDTFVYLSISDHAGQVRAATHPDFALTSGSREVRRLEDVVVTEMTGPDEIPVLDFETDILFQDTRVGKIHLGLSREGFNEVMDTTRLLMLVLGLVTLAAVVGMLYVFGSLLTKPLRMLAKSMEVFGGGDWDHRPSSVRNDEVGQLYGAFNNMADAVQMSVEQSDEALDEDETESQLDATVIMSPPETKA